MAALKTRRPVGHVMRTVYGFIGTVTSVYGFGVLPLVTVTALGFAMPLFLTIVVGHRCWAKARGSHVVATAVWWSAWSA